MITEACCGLAGKQRMHESISFHPSLRNSKRTAKKCGLCAELAKGRLVRDIPSDIWRNEVIHQEGCPMQLFVVKPRAHSCPGLIAVLPVLFIIYLHGPAPICWVLRGYWWGPAKITKEWPSDIFLFSVQWEWMICRLIPKPWTGKIVQQIVDQFITPVTPALGGLMLIPGLHGLSMKVVCIQVGPYKQNIKTKAKHPHR